MFSPDRQPHPVVSEIRFLQQPVAFVPTRRGPSHVCYDKSAIHVVVRHDSTVAAYFVVSNRYAFRDLSHLAWTWELTSNRSATSIRSSQFSIQGYEKGPICLRLDEIVSRVRQLEKSKPNYGNTFWLNLSGALKEDSVWANAGHRLVSHQFRIEFCFDETVTPATSPRKRVPGSDLETSESDDLIQIFQISCGIRRELATFEKETGSLISYSPFEHNFLASQGIAQNFVRAATDNDRGGMELVFDFMLIPTWLQDAYYSFIGKHECSYLSHWKEVGLDGTSCLKVICESIRLTPSSDNENVGVVALCTLSSPSRHKKLFKVKLHYNIFNDGRIRINTHVHPLRTLKHTASLARVGFTMVLEPSLYNIQYYGRGPDENYPDRKTASELSVYNTTPSSMAYLDYIFPAENGSRSDCEYIAFRSIEGCGLSVVSTGPNDSPSTFSCSAQLHSIANLQLATHTCDLEKRTDGIHPIHVNIDHKLMGLGGDCR